MAISSISLSPSFIGIQASQFQAEIDARSPAANLQPKESGVIAQFSVFGQFQSSLSDLQSKAQSLRNLSMPPNFQDLQVVVQGFVQSINSLKESVSRLASKQSAPNADSKLGQAVDSVRKAVDRDGGNALPALQKVGVSRQADGMFSVNDKQLGEIFQNDRSGALSAVFEVADRFAQVAGKQYTPSAQRADTVSYAASQAVTSYVSVAAL
ncbi:MAG: hypothetical protein A3F73_12210 [Gallionellales bacterium RIFCSPLOWO2_12_FULL_59_22]|nr:MAG: hypothetical protein A3H99_01510 [Gallionellales bacterium RIFCSPLOWO2_02_FULL_59_110]OGT03976.1 MAG: hypothetical protein A2Z65_06785 [Gallionellales bacterium RIFCSPLOWO2_02_58_13]OGT12226.1 MAG: hypothetical protein A3F73_12210 [Gallionellales bacterium RIFCSPLOWO2_12_FULL_59_22]